MDVATNPIEKKRTENNILDPISRTSEILFGLIMVLSFTCSMSAAEVGRDDVRELLIGALGCNIAWGIIDAFFYLMSLSAQRGREITLIKKLKEVPEQSAARELFESVIPESIIGSLTPKSFSEIRDHLLKYYSDHSANLITLADLRSAFRVFALVFLSTFPVAIPFMVMQDAPVALRVSNIIALILLFSLGFSLGKFAGRRPIIWGLAMTIIGASLVSMTIALGG